MPKRWRITFELVLVLMVLVSYAYVAVAPGNNLMHFYTSDDAFYYYKVAQNITEGRGVSFDGIGITNGFHPLWMLICIPLFALARFNLFLPLRLVVMVLALLNAGTGVMLYRLFKQLLSTPTAMLAAVAWAFLPQIQRTVTFGGLEAGVSVFCVVLLVYQLAAWQKERPLIGDHPQRLLMIAGAGILALFGRLDNAFTVFFAGLYMFLLAFKTWDGARETPRIGWLRRLGVGVMYYFPVGTALGAYLLTNYLYAGTPMPVSGMVKRWWSTLPATVYGQPVLGWRNFISYWFTNNRSSGPWSLITDVPNRLADAVYSLLPLQGSELFLKNVNRSLVAGFALLLLGIALWLVIKNWNVTWRALVRFSILPLFLGCSAQIASYRIIPYVHTRPWYWAVEMVVIVLVLASVVEGLVQALRRWKVPAEGTWAGAGAVMAVVFFSFAYYTVKLVPQTLLPENANNYRLEALGIERLTEPGSLIGCTGAGTIGYFIQDRTVVPLDGLINSYEYFTLLQAGKAYEYLDKIGLNYVWGNAYMITKTDPYATIFKGRLEEVDHVESGNVYRYLPGIQP